MHKISVPLYKAYFVKAKKYFYNSGCFCLFSGIFAQFIIILQISYLQLTNDIKICGRAVWRHNLDILYIKAGLASNITDTMKWLVVLSALVAFSECLLR